MRYVVTDFVGVLRGITKTNLDVVRATFDFSNWLRGNETVLRADNFQFSVTPPNSGTWQLVPYTVPPPEVPADTTMLELSGSPVIDAGTQLDVLLAGGTPGVGYVVSFVVTTSDDRQKEIDVFVLVEDVNLGTTPVPPIPSSTTVTQTTVLPAGTIGNVFVANGTAAPITITLPATSTVGWTIHGTDVLGNAEADNITWQGAGGALIVGQATFVFIQNYQSADFVWNGTGWSVQ